MHGWLMMAYVAVMLKKEEEKENWQKTPKVDWGRL